MFDEEHHFDLLPLDLLQTRIPFALMADIREALQVLSIQKTAIEDEVEALTQSLNGSDLNGPGIQGNLLDAQVRINVMICL